MAEFDAICGPYMFDSMESPRFKHNKEYPAVLLEIQSLSDFNVDFVSLISL